MTNNFPISAAEEKFLRGFFKALHMHQNVRKWDFRKNAGTPGLSKKFAASKDEFVERTINRITTFRLGNVHAIGDWREQAGQGIIISLSGDEHSFKNSTPEEDKTKTNVMLLGIDYSGSKYAAKYVRTAVKNKLFDAPEDVIVHSLSLDPKQRSLQHAQPYLAGDLNAVSQDSIDIVKKYILPRITDERGNYRTDIFKGDKPYNLNFVCHSHGCTLGHIVENSLREALLVDPEKYGLKEKADSAYAKKVMSSTKIIAFGGSMVNPEPNETWKDIKDVPFMTSMHFIACDDILMAKKKDVLGAHVYYNNGIIADGLGMPSPFSTVRCPYEHHRTMTILEIGDIKAENERGINVAGHGFDFLLEAISQEDYTKNIMGTVKLVMANNSFDLARFSMQRMGANRFDSAFFEKIFDRAPEKAFQHLEVAYHSIKETLAWEDKTKKHPIYGEIFSPEKII